MCNLLVSADLKYLKSNGRAVSNSRAVAVLVVLMAVLGGGGEAAAQAQPSATPAESRGASVAKGVFAFNVLASIAYSGAAFSRTGPVERDTRGVKIGMVVMVAR